MSFDTEILADNPLHYWKLDEVLGVVVTDYGSLANNGVYQNTPSLNNRSLSYKDTVGKSVNFSAGTDYVTLGVDAIRPGLIGATSLTVEALIRPTNFSAFQPILFVKQNSTISGLSLSIETTGIKISARSDAADSAQEAIALIIDINKIYHVVGVVNFAKSTITIYVDGVLQATTEATFTNTTFNCVVAGTNEDTIAASNLSTDDYIGKVQNVVVYTGALSAERIRAHYRATVPYTNPVSRSIAELNPLGFWPLDESSGDALDWAGGEFDLVNTGPTQGGTSLIATDTETSYAYVSGSTQFSGRNLPIEFETLNVTYLAIVKPSAIGASMTIVHGSPTGANVGRGFILQIVASGAVQAAKGQGAGFDVATTVGTLIVGQVGVIAATYDGTDLKIYLNGEEIVVAAATAIPWTDSGTGPSPAQFGISGRRSDIAGTDPNLQLADCEVQYAAIFDYAVTAVDVQSIYEAVTQENKIAGYTRVLQNLGPTIHYPLGELAGPEAVDFSGNNFNVPYIGTIAPGAIANVHQDPRGSTLFNGVDSRLTVGAVTDFIYVKNTQVYTIVFNIKVNDLLTDNQCIIGNTRTLVTVEGFDVYYKSGLNRIQIRVMSGGSVQTTVTTPAGTLLNDGMWHNVILTSDGVNSTSYVDGVNSGNIAIGANGAGNNTNILDIGLEPSGSAPLGADLQHLSISPVAVDAQGAKQICQAYTSRYAAEVISNQPVGYWRMNEASGSIIDYGSASNPGTAVGGPTFSDVETPITNEVGHTSMLFDGVDDHLDMGSMSSEFTAIGTGDYTMLAWLRPTDIDATTQIICGWRTDTTSADDFTLLLIDGGTDEIGILAREAAGSEPIIVGRVPTENEWLFAAGARLSGVMNFSENGTQVVNQTDVINLNVFVDQVFQVGAEGFDAFEFPFAGQIAEVAFFQSSISAEELLDIYQSAFINISSFLGFSGTIFESEAITKWQVDVVRADTLAILGTTIVDTEVLATYTIDVATSGYTGDCLILFKPVIGNAWLPSTAYSLNDYVIATDSITTPHIWICTVAGTSAASEPSWNLTGNTVDGTVTWTYVNQLVRAIVQGPLIPTA